MKLAVQSEKGLQNSHGINIEIDFESFSIGKFVPYQLSITHEHAVFDLIQMSLSFVTNICLLINILTTFSFKLVSS